jgi:membrane-bound lytic murein transglycosylase MltF
MKRIAAALLVVLALQACSRGTPGQSAKAEGPAKPNEQAVPAYELALPDYLRAKISQPFKDDLDGMIQRRIIRVAAPFSRTHFYLDGATQRGLSYEFAKLYEDKLNEGRGKEQPRIYVIMLPVPRDRLLSELNAGKVDMVAAQLTITPERLQQADFTAPTRTGINEVWTSGPGTSAVTSEDDLADRTVFARKSSSYYRSLEALNQRLKSRGKKPVDIQPAPENLEDDDLLEMVNAGLIPATVVDDYLAEFWKQVFPALVLSEQAPLRTGGNIGVAIRKGSPKLAASLNDFIGKYGLKSAIGATINKRYLQSTTYVKNAASDAERKKFVSTVDLFRKYGTEYNFDYLLMAAQGYQESRLDQNAKSPVGAIGVMQLMPKTGQELATGDIHQVEPNVHAGVKYMSAIESRYFANEPMDRVNKELFTFASYNAGPGRIRQLRREAAERGLNPNLWFGNVEQIAAERIGSETVTYVGNIFKYYIAYKLIVDQQTQREAARQALATAKAR